MLRNHGARVDVDREAIHNLVASTAESIQDVDLISGFSRCAEALRELDDLLNSAEGVGALLESESLESEVSSAAADVDRRIAEVESSLDRGEMSGEVDLEALYEVLSVLKDASWSISRDRLRTASAVAQMAGTRSLAARAVSSYTSIQLALSAIDRLEVRGRDSAGITVIASTGGTIEGELARRVDERKDGLFLSRAVDRSRKSLIFVYKAAAEIGALGDNVKRIRDSITEDALLRSVLLRDDVEVSVIAHTRWASVGTISEANASPLDSQEPNGADVSCVVAALNGDIDNYADLKVAERLHFPEEITTDVKVIPMMTSRRLSDGDEMLTAFHSTVSRFEGSFAIAAAAADHADRMYLAVKGSGQGCYVGLADGAFVVASEPYGLVEVCSTYLRLDGEAASQVSGKQGQIVELRSDRAGTIEGIRRISFGGEELPVAESELRTAEVTTRDIDRRGAEHFLLKEISESPLSVRRTLRGKIVDENGKLTVALPNESLPASVVSALRSGVIKHVLAIGQGTAAIAASSLVSMLEAVVPGRVMVLARPATELSGFGLRDDMSDTLVVAVSQSGTTTDTNRTVDLLRSRGAQVIAVVNRRQSDLTQRADGVLYTSDGRDVEMSVASTKAFYAQVTACSLLAVAIAQALGDVDRRTVHDVLNALRSLPDAMTRVLDARPEIARTAHQYAPYRRSWAIVGSGPNYIAAREVRIKLSELCYKSIAIDVTEDKKHIDLSAEPMILVCAAGLDGSNASDVAKEVAIYRAHKAAAIVIATDGTRFDAAAATISVPSLHPLVDFVLSTMVGHLFGYEAALAIDSQARLMRNARAAIDDVISVEHDDPDKMLWQLRPAIAAPAQAIFAEVQSGALNGHLEPSTAVRVVSLLRYATGALPLDALELETGRPTSPSSMVSDLLLALNAAVDELTRPIDAVKHQAKTVTVGISRTEDTFADNWLVQHAVSSGALRDRLSYRSMRTLAALAPAVQEVVGFTRYEIQGGDDEGGALLRVVDKGGVARDITSRVEVDPRLTGTKHRAAFERVVIVGRGQRDGREVIIIPESKDQQATGITLLHVEFKRALDAETARSVLTGYRNRYSALVDAVTETEPNFDDERLATLPMIDLLVEPVWLLARHWR